jgi:hypothetical protein
MWNKLKESWQVAILVFAVTLGLGSIVTTAAVNSGMLLFAHHGNYNTAANVPIRISGGPAGVVSGSSSGGGNLLMTMPAKVNTDAFVGINTNWSENVYAPLSIDATGNLRVKGTFSSQGLGSGSTGGTAIGIPVSDTYAAINISTNTTTLIVTGVSGRHIRIGAMNLMTALANNVALISGTGATCGTGTAGVAGGTTAASGWNFIANGGLTLGTGLGTVLKTVATGDSLCLVTSVATQLSGGVSYAIY